MYKIIGGDKKEYGPVSADDLRHWIAEGRLNPQSLIQAEGSREWRPLATFAEFADALRSQTGPVPSRETAAPPVNAEVWSAQILARPAELQVGRCLARSWTLLLDNFGLFFGAAFLVWIIGVVCQFIPMGSIVYGVVRGVFYGGLYLVFLKRIRNQPASVGEVFAGFSPGFPQLLLAGFVSSLLTGVGFVFCFVPGIYLLVAWTFSVPLVADKRLEFWSAMELSRKMVTRVWFGMFGLMVVAFVPLILVNVIAGVKISEVVFSSMQGIMGSGQPDPKRIIEMVTNIFKTTLPLALLVKLVFLLNWPFALGALMYAYEDLFGARTTPAA